MALKTINVGQTTTGTLAAVDQNNQPIAIDASYTVQWNSSDPSKVSFGAVNPDGSCLITGIAGTPGIAIGARISGGTIPTGQSVNASTETLIIVTPPVLTSASVSLT